MKKCSLKKRECLKYSIELCCWYLLSPFSPIFIQNQVLAARATDELDQGFVVTEESHSWGHFHYSEDGYGQSIFHEARERSRTPLLQNPELPKPRIEHISNLSYLGCYQYWSATNFMIILPPPIPVYFSKTFLDKISFKLCAELCQQDPQAKENYELVMVRGEECTCTKWEFFNKTRIVEDYCNVTCQDVGGETDSSWKCGGNLAVSVYCLDKNHEKCNSRNGTEFEGEELEIEGYDPGILENYSREMGAWVDVNRKCMLCTLLDADFAFLDCFGFTGFAETHDYFPQNNPLACALNCKRGIEVNGKPWISVAAYLTWRIVKLGHFVPQCVCRQTLPQQDFFISASEEHCNEQCPVTYQSDDVCGNRGNISYMSVYLIENFSDQPGYDEDHSSTDPTAQSTNSTQEPTTTSTDVTTIEVTTTTEATTTEGATTTEPTTTPGTTTTEATTTKLTTTTEVTTTNLLNSNTTTEVTTTTTIITTTEQTSTAKSTSSPPVIPGTTPQASSTETPCTKKCSAFFHIPWEACPGETAKKLCKENSTFGWQTWRCLENSSFEFSHPDTSECVTPWYNDLRQNVTETLKQNNNTIPMVFAENMLQTMEELCKPNENNNRPYYGHEIEYISGIAYQLVNASNASMQELQRLLTKSITLSGMLLSNKDPWQDLYNISARTNVANEFLKNLQKTAFTLSKYAHNEGFVANFKSSNLTTDQFYVNFGFGSPVAKEPLIFPHGSVQHGSFIRLEEGWESIVKNPDYVGYLIDSEHFKYILPASLNNLRTSRTGSALMEKVHNSKLLSLSIKDLTETSQLSDNLKGKKVRITFQHDVEAWGSQAQVIQRKLHPNEVGKVAMGSATCVYWNMENKLWASDGCKLIQTSSTSSICECTHLTSFAILMDPHKYVGKDFALEILTFILCPVSVLCLLISVIVLSSVNAIQSQRTTITKHLCACLMIGMIFLLLLVDRNYFPLPQGLCIAIGITTHYVYLAAFMWMAIEGVHLYKMVVHVFDSGRSRTTMYRIIAYGVPVIIVGVTCVVGFMLNHQPYGGEMYCWLEGPYTWSFIIPVVFVVMGNMIILFVALKTAYQMNATSVSVQARQRSYKTWVRGSFSITVLLGITWLPGFIMIGNSPMAAKISAYIFVILNGSQGIFLFIFHCLLNEKVRRAAERNLSLPSWLSVTPPSKEPSQVGRRSENMRAYFSEEAKAKHNANQDNYWSKSSPGSKTGSVESGSVRSDWSNDPNFFQQSYNGYPNVLHDQRVQSVARDSNKSNNSQRFLTSVNKRK